ncbi:hypothetical protein CEXT_677061 [Caerostris extrusa]|uniref:Uncharacterized protein n=1 Tax=Caerostris extrusa TaxID=172846 RepID=A0AAV4NJV5_CAEEX|nr:hypothetical protein CEXT_677061 [Caerostris extrusa]
MSMDPFFFLRFFGTPHHIIDQHLICSPVFPSYNSKKLFPYPLIGDQMDYLSCKNPMSSALAFFADMEF